MLPVWIRSALFAAAMSAAPVAAAQTSEAAWGKPTIVLVRGALAESASRNGVITDLRAPGYTGASHAMMILHPHEVSAMIGRAETAPADAR